MNMIGKYFDEEEYKVIENEKRDDKEHNERKYSYKLFIYLNNSKREYMIFTGFIWEEYLSLFNNIPRIESNYKTQAGIVINLKDSVIKCTTNDLGTLLLYLNRDGHKIRTVEQGYYDGKIKHVIKTATMYEKN